MRGPFAKRSSATVDATGVALGLIELGSIARGHLVLDAMVKKAPVVVVTARAVSPGKFVVLVSGDVASVNESMQIGRELGADKIVATLELAQVATMVVEALAGKFTAAPVDGAVGVLELGNVSATLLSADAAVKAAEVTLCGLHLADGIGGKGYFVVGGEQGDVEAALDAGAAISSTVVEGKELIARPHADYLVELWK